MVVQLTDQTTTVGFYHLNIDQISEDFFKHLVEFMPLRMKAVLKAIQKQIYGLYLQVLALNLLINS